MITAKQIHSARIEQFLTIGEVAAQSDLTPKQVENAEQSDSTTKAAVAKREAIAAAIEAYGTGLPHLGREIEWTENGGGGEWSTRHKGVVIRSPDPQHTDSVRVFWTEMDVCADVIVHKSKITRVTK